MNTKLLLAPTKCPVKFLRSNLGIVTPLCNCLWLAFCHSLLFTLSCTTYLPPSGATKFTLFLEFCSLHSSCCPLWLPSSLLHCCISSLSEKIIAGGGVPFAMVDRLVSLLWHTPFFIISIARTWMGYCKGLSTLVTWGWCPTDSF